jgi:hypothetical protein
MSMPDDKPWKPPAIPADVFHQPDSWTNINRAPYDVVSGVTYKQASNIKRVRYEPLDAAPESGELWQGRGAATVRWLFSEKQKTEENILTGAKFLFLQDIDLDAGAASGQTHLENELRILYSISGEGVLYHRACQGCPAVARPLREGDAALIQDGEIYSIDNKSESQPFRLILIGFRQS